MNSFVRTCPACSSRVTFGGVRRNSWRPQWAKVRRRRSRSVTTSTRSLGASGTVTNPARGDGRVDGLTARGDGGADGKLLAPARAETPDTLTALHRPLLRTVHESRLFVDAKDGDQRLVREHEPSQEVGNSRGEGVEMRNDTEMFENAESGDTALAGMTQ